MNKRQIERKLSELKKEKEALERKLLDISNEEAKLKERFQNEVDLDELYWERFYF